ncbi:YhgE/Pip domain-containing protein [Gottfriedia solisilvae]|uniref:Phage infection protein n=1 Tax=Gottfriedia solisilvae TaxID=1516104 RepID=A0A8J3AKQ9_9BACI|nr:ABC transporter permease [Gottfriedia solisilvae]GGI15655.1 phage infection protein [Gottfriedia solisilvae]
MNLLKQKQALLAPIIVLVVVVIFSLTLASSVNPTPKNLPIAIVNEDEGITVPTKGEINLGKIMVSKINEVTNSQKESAVNWIQVSSEDKVRKGLDDKKYYAALILPKDLSQKQATLMTPNPSPIEIKVLLNQGMNANASTMAGQILNNVVSQLSMNIRTEVLSELEKNNTLISANQASVLAIPILNKIENVNEIGTHTANGNAPVILITPLWMSSLIGAVIIFLGKKKANMTTSVNKLKVILEQIALAIILAFVAGFGITLMADWIGFTIPNFIDTALYLTIAYFSFHILISAVMSWVGFGGVALFALIFFFAGSIIGVAPELLPKFTHDWIYSWVPMRFGADGLREIFYFGKELSFSHSMVILVWIASVSTIVLLASAFKQNKIQKEQQLSLNE